MAVVPIRCGPSQLLTSRTPAGGVAVTGQETGWLSGSIAMVVRLDSTGGTEFARRYPPGDEQTDRYRDRSRT